MEERKRSNKGKAIMGFCISVLFVLLGVALLSGEVAENSDLPPIVIKGIGISSIFIFGILGLLHLNRLIRK